MERHTTSAFACCGNPRPGPTRQISERPRQCLIAVLYTLRVSTVLCGSEAVNSAFVSRALSVTFYLRFSQSSRGRAAGRGRVHRVPQGIQGVVSPAARADYQWRRALRVGGARRAAGQRSCSLARARPAPLRRRSTPRRRSATPPEDKFGANRNR